MTPTIFEGLLQRIAQVGHKQDTTFRKCIPLGARLAMSLRYFATGDSLQSIAFGFRCGKSTASEIVIEMAKTIFTVLSPEFLRVPTTSEWKEIASDFFIRWNFANCCGAIDGQHVSIRCPGNSGSVYYNYKGFFSIVLMAMCDAKYRFTLYDIGAYGRELSRARRIIENAFGIMSARFQLFLKSISADPKNVNHFVKAGLALHNFLITQDKNYSDADFADHYLHNGVVQPGQWRQELKKRTTCFTKLASSSFKGNGTGITNIYTNMFSRLSVPWQSATVRFLINYTLLRTTWFIDTLCIQHYL
ncbi:Uncharacterized protein APZ42_029622 [Daphnia magna]|uniref:Uncharacterized protein n=1 Tax=Daphnia magna TaxID=35525 RepID=A0A164PG12_9CRUS|nr:Uncharacterized protein APZ42_029622 [Daphnia magna]